MLVRSFWPKTLSLALKCGFSQLTKHPLLDSQFFMLGPRSTPSHKPISKLFNTTFSQIEKLQALLQEKGQRLLKKYRQEQLSTELSRPSQQGEVKEYLQAYRSLVQVVQKSKIQNQQTYNIIGWYNMIPLKKILVEKLFSAKFEELPQLIESLSWMNGNQGSIEEFFESRQEYLEKSTKFYRKLPYSLTIDQLKKIDEILKPTSYLQQRKFYEAYLRHNLENILRDVHSSRDEQFVDDIIWLLETSVKAMNDCQLNLSKVEKFILTWRPKISSSSLQKLINVYCQLGKNNPFIYQAYFKQYLHLKLKQPSASISILKYLVCTQNQDRELLRSCWEQLNSAFTNNTLSQAQLSQLHTYVHFLQISGERTNLNKQLHKKMHLGCKQEHCISFINSLVFRQKSNKATLSKMKKTNYKYISQCLQQKNEKKIDKLQNLEREQFKEEYGYQLAGTNFSELDIYKNVSFCNFQLEYLLHNRIKNEVVNIQTNCESYTFNSGLLKREVMMRDEILEHYGIRVNHINAQKYQVKERKLSQEESMMVSKPQKKKVKV